MDFFHGTVVQAPQLDILPKFSSELTPPKPRLASTEELMTEKEGYRSVVLPDLPFLSLGSENNKPEPTAPVTVKTVPLKAPVNEMNISDERQRLRDIEIYRTRQEIQYAQNRDLEAYFGDHVRGTNITRST